MVNINHDAAIVSARYQVNPAFDTLTIFYCFLFSAMSAEWHERGQRHTTQAEEKMERLLPTTWVAPFLASSNAKRCHQEAIVHLAYQRGLITKAEIDTMLKQVDELDGSCLSVIAERKRQWQQQHGGDERGISPRAILSRLQNWLIGG